MKSAFVTLPSSFFNFAALFSSRLTLKMPLFYDDDNDDDDDDDNDNDDDDDDDDDNDNDDDHDHDDDVTNLPSELSRRQGGSHPLYFCSSTCRSPGSSPKDILQIKSQQ